MARTSTLRFETMAELLDRLGGIAPERVRLQPPPGQATERDLLRLHEHTDRLYELVDGTLVEKVMGYPEARLALRIGRLLGNYVEEHDLGDLAGADGTMRLMPGLVRIPDVSFVSWKRVPNRELLSEPIPGLAPDLAIEVLSQRNTPREMERKLKEYFLSDVRVVWFVDPRKRTVEVFTAPDRSVLLTEEQALDGGDVLPGLSLPLKAIFAQVPRLAAKAPRQKSASPRTRPKPKGRPPSE
jgi:Uma2 family endonuclease